MLRAIKILVEEVKSQTPVDDDQELVVFKLDSDLTFKVEEDKDGNFVVFGNKIEQFAIKTDFDNHEARQRLRAILDKLGIKRELQQLGYQDQLIFFGEDRIGELRLTEALEE